MMKSFILLVFCETYASAITPSLTRFKNFEAYLPNVIQETIYEVEKRGWWNLRLNDLTVSINERIYDRNFVGTVRYTDGFLISIEKMEFVDGQQSFSSTEGTMRGFIVFHDTVVGYNCFADLNELGQHNYTGTYVINTMRFQVFIIKNMNTNETRTSVTENSASAPNVRIQFLPLDDIAEVLSRHFALHLMNFDPWGTEVMAPILLDIINTKFPLPDICFNHC